MHVGLERVTIKKCKVRAVPNDHRISGIVRGRGKCVMQGRKTNLKCMT